MTRRGPQSPFVLKALTCEATKSDDSKQRPFQDEEPTKITPNQQRQCVCVCNKSLEEKRLSDLLVLLVFQFPCRLVMDQRKKATPTCCLTCLIVQPATGTHT